MDALAPYLTAEAIEVHYSGHHGTYVRKLNELLDQSDKDEGPLERIIQNHDGPLFNNAAQAWNHTFLWHGLCPLGMSEMPEDAGDFAKAIDQGFGGLAQMQHAFKDCASRVFGSGYVWLTVDSMKHLEFIHTHNADNPIRFERMRPLWNCDLWEHAYYINYRNKREEFVTKTWDHINWDFVENNFLHDSIPNMTKFMTSMAKMEAATGQHSAPVFE
jgi:Fe-Mn family superoxide dismutase